MITFAPDKRYCHDKRFSKDSYCKLVPAILDPALKLSVYIRFIHTSNM